MKIPTQKLRQWWSGTVAPYDNNGNDSGIYIFVVHQDRHWTSRAARAVASFMGREWKWLAGFSVAVAMAFITYLGLP